MKPFAVTRIESIPRLAWLVDIGDTITALCGSDVEAFDRGVFEGCWAGPFADYGFAGAENVFGSGFVVGENGLTLVTATHTLEPVFVLRRGDQISASNSLAFLVEHCALDLPVQERWIGKLGSVVEGIRKYERLIYADGATELYRFVFANVEIAGTDVREVAKVQRDGFSCFKDYRTYLADTIRNAAANAADPARIRTYELIASMSSGYDSSTVAALSAEAGCRQAVSIAESNDGYSDSGKPVADRLGLECIEVRRPPRAEGNDFPEAEFFACGTGGGDYVYAASFGQYLPGRILTTGFLGIVGLPRWYQTADATEADFPPNRELYKGDYSGTRFYEFRIRTGFIHVPVPFIGAVNQPDLIRISHSDEMADYRLGTAYDRPIARRILEEAGVPRDLFGQRKKKVGLMFYRDESLMSPNSRDDFYRYLAAKASFADRVRDRWQSLEMYFWNRARFGPGRRLPGPLLAIVHRAYGRCTDRFFVRHRMDLQFLWALEKIRPRYRVAVEKARKAA